MEFIKQVGIPLTLGLLIETIVAYVGYKTHDENKRVKVLFLGTLIAAIFTASSYWLISILNSPLNIQILPVAIFIFAIIGVVLSFKIIKNQNRLFFAVIFCLAIMTIGAFWFGKNYSYLSQSANNSDVISTEISMSSPTSQGALASLTPGLQPTQPKSESTEIPTQTITPSPSISISPTATATQSQTNTSTPSVSLPFIDSFDPKPRPEWDFYRGEWHGFEGHLTGQLNLNERQISLVGDKNWRNYRISVECYSYDFIYPVLIILRASHENYIMLRFSQLQGLDWVAFDQGKETIIAHKKMTFPRRFETTYIFTVEVNDDILTAFVDEEQVSQVQIPEPMMDRFSMGMVGVGYEPAGHLVWFDDFKVEAVP